MVDTLHGPGDLITFPDLSGCMSDGGTIEEALANGADAEKAWIAASTKWGDAVPEPGSTTNAPGRFVLRTPKSLHAKLSRQTAAEDVSMNTLNVTLLAEGLGRKQAGR